MSWAGLRMQRVTPRVLPTYQLLLLTLRASVPLWGQFPQDYHRESQCRLPGLEASVQRRWCCVHLLGSALPWPQPVQELCMSPALGVAWEPRKPPELWIHQSCTVRSAPGGPMEPPPSVLPATNQTLPLLPQPLTVLEGALVQTVPAQRPLCKADINISLRGWQGVSLQPMGHLGVPTPHCRCARPCPMGFTHTHGRSIALTRVPELPRRPGRVGWSATLRWAGPGHCLGQQGVVMVWRVDLGLQGL